MTKYIYYIINRETGERVTEITYRKRTAREDGRRYYRRTDNIYDMRCVTDTPEGRAIIAGTPTGDIPR